jgi:glutamine cyclotransferase
MGRDADHVLNGIAWNDKTDTYYLTGKLWPVMLEVRIKEK